MGGAWINREVGSWRQEVVPKASAEFWEQYRDVVISQGVKPTAARWYAVRAERFIAAFPGRRLAELGAEDSAQYLTSEGQKSSVQDWQFRQTVDAIRILYSIARTYGSDLAFCLGCAEGKTGWRP